MQMTIGKKLTACFLGLAALVLTAGVVGIVVLNKSSKSADTVAKEKAPVQYAVMNAALAVDKVQKHMVRFMNADRGLPELEANVTRYLDEFDMWIAMVQQGTEADAFKNSRFQQLYNKNQLDIVVPENSANIAAVVESIVQESSSYREHANDLITAHEYLISYSVKTSGGKITPLPEFLNLAQRKHLDWLKVLRDSINLESPFTGITDPEKGLVGEWLYGYSVENEELMETVAKTKKRHNKLRALAVKINAESGYEAKLKLFKRGIASTSRIERYFDTMHKLSASIYTDLTASEDQKFETLTASADSINTHLGELIKTAEKEMKEALAASESVVKNGSTFLVVLTIAAGIIAVVMGGIMSRYLTGRISAITEATKRISEGDLRNTVDSRSNDELGDLAGDTNSMISNLREMIGQVTDSSGNLARSSAGLAEVSGSLDSTALDLGAKATGAADATAVMSSSMLDISTTANDSMERVQSVALATEEMSTTISEIANNAEQARMVTKKAVVTVNTTTEKMNELSEAAKEIGKVADVIVNIADQTNLLSLNATIEAARAGEAGKGFAVVANEVKELASQTNQATEDIRHKIGAIQKSSDMTITEIGDISNIISDINSIVVAIAGAVEEQAATTKQITEDINSVSGGIENMTQNVNSTTERAESVADDIGAVNSSSSSVQDVSAMIKSSSTELEKLAGELQTLVGRFQL